MTCFSGLDLFSGRFGFSKLDGLVFIGHRIFRSSRIWFGVHQVIGFLGLSGSWFGFSKDWVWLS
jgi:hypothetical protein